VKIGYVVFSVNLLTNKQTKVVENTTSLAEVNIGKSIGQLNKRRERERERERERD